MNLLIKCCPDRFTLCLAANVLVQIAVLAALAWLLASAVARHRPALCHGIWLSALLCILLSPAVSYLAVPAGLSLVSLPWLPRPLSPAVKLPPPPPPESSIEPSLLAVRDMLEARNPGLRPDFAPMRPMRPVQNGVSPIDQEAAPAERTASVTPPPAAGDKLRAVLGLAVLLWTTGTLLFLVRLLRGWLRVVRLQRWAPPASDPTARSFVSGRFAGRTRLEAVLAEVRHDLNVAVLPRLAILPRESKLCGPITVGVFRSLVILHETLIETLDARGLRNVLLHEFAHALRRDPLVGLLQRLAEAVFWPYPPVHLVNRRLAAAREEVCDNYVLRRGDAADYAETLLTIYESLRGVRLHPSTLGLCHPCGNLERRVAGMLNPRRNVMVRMYRVTAAGTAALFLTTVVLVAGTRLVEAQTKAPPEARTPPAADAGGKKEAAGEQDGKKGGGRGLAASLGPLIDSLREQWETVTGGRPQGNCSIAGKVVAEATGKPVPHVRMYLFYLRTFSALFVDTGSDGTFAFKNIPSGPCSLQTSHTAGYQDCRYDPDAKGGQFPEFSLKEGEQRGGIVFKVKQACRISGKVFDEQGKLPHDAGELTVYAWVKSDGGKDYRAEQATIHESDCSYVIDGLSDKPAYVMALVRRAPRGVETWPPIYYPSTFSRSQARLVTFEKARSVENVNITRRRGGGLVIAGTVRDPSGKPIPEALVAVHHRDMLFDQAAAYSDVQGRYEIQGLGEGELLAHVDAAYRGFVRTRLPITLDGSKPKTEQNFTLTQGVSISGKLVDRKGNAWEIAQSYGQANVVSKDKSGNHSYSGLENEYGPNVVRPRRYGGHHFVDGNGPYEEGQMLFPTTSTFLIQGVLPGHTQITFAPQKEGQKVAEIRYAGRDILNSGVDTKPGQAIKDVTIVIETSALPAADKKPAVATGKQQMLILNSLAPAIGNADQPAVGQQMLELPVRVVDAHDKPVAGARITPWALGSSQGHGEWNDNDKAAGVGPKEVVTGEDGTATVLYPRDRDVQEQVRTRAVSLRVDHPKFAYVDSLHINVPLKSKGPYEVKLPPGVPVEIHPLLDGKAMSLDGVFLMWSDGRSWRKGAAPEKTAGGSLRISAMPPGKNSVLVAKLDGQRATHFSQIVDFELAAGEPKKIDMPLQPSLRIQGVLSDNVLRPVRQGRIVTMTLPPAGAGQYRVRWFTWTAIRPDGTFTIDGWPAEEQMQLIALCDGYIAASGRAPDVVQHPRDPQRDPFHRPQVFDIGKNDRITVTMSPLVRCVATAVDQNGKPVASVTVRSWPNVGWWNVGSGIYCYPLVRGERWIRERDPKATDEAFPVPFQETTDAQGKATLELPAGGGYLAVKSDQYELPVLRGNRYVPVKLPPDRTTEVTLRLQPSGTETLGEWHKKAADEAARAKDGKERAAETR